MYDNSFLSIGKNWPPDSEIERLNTYARNRELFKGEHEKVFSAQRYVLMKDGKDLIEFNLNWNKRLSVLFADLLFNEPPHISVGTEDSQEQIFLTDLLEQTEFLDVSYKVTIDLHRYGTGLYKTYLSDSKVKIQCLTPAIWFPVVEISDINNVIEHVIAYDNKVKSDQKSYSLFVEEHFKGRIVYHTFFIQEDKIAKQIDAREEETGIDDFLIADVQNIATSDDFIGMDDYMDLDTIISGLERRFIQRGKILDKHADPNMTGPRTVIKADPITGATKVDVGGGRYFPRNPGDVEVQYVTWEGQLAAVEQEIVDLMEQLYALSETCPALFGQLKAGLAESGSALKRLLISPLLKTLRFKKCLDPVMKKVLVTASKLAGTGKMNNTILFDKKTIAIDWQDGLPNDTTEQIANESTAVNSGLSSQESSVKRLWNLEGEALTRELDKINKEQAAKQPNPPSNVLPNALSPLEEKFKAITINAGANANK